MTLISAATQLPATVATTIAHGPYHHDGPGWWIIFPILWFALIATAITFFVVNGRRRWRYAGRRTGEQTLAQRYAEGAIDEDEYRTRLETLRRMSGS
jgi:putative membrane protein